MLPILCFQLPLFLHLGEWMMFCRVTCLMGWFYISRQFLPNGIVQAINKVFGNVDVEICNLGHEVFLIVGFLADFDYFFSDLCIVNIS
jgi:hypothetical protein